jgi:hypothetical protein
MKLALIIIAGLALAACADVDTFPKPVNNCVAYTRDQYVRMAMAGRGLTEQAATAERDAYCGVGK